jgi:uncharacterized protein (DUF2062 family)
MEFLYLMDRIKDLIKRLLHIKDTPERTALAYSIGIFLGFSPFLGFHTLGGVAVAFLFGLSRVAVLLGVWSNTPWWFVPYYVAATWIGVWITGFRIEKGALQEIFRMGMEKGFLGSDFWSCLTSQWGFLLSFFIGSTVLATILSLALYPLSLTWIKFYRSRRH